jgi:hypothetical protein
VRGVNGQLAYMDHGTKDEEKSERSRTGEKNNKTKKTQKEKLKIG